mmetsp:Transcript_17109/g.49577  ORF Transcript_17109/g.49577 Transcript_17109/m.49577 type:complete len:207 (-) Transcript_17109:343-963(-)
MPRGLCGPELPQEASGPIAGRREAEARAQPEASGQEPQPAPLGQAAEVLPEESPDDDVQRFPYLVLHRHRPRRAQTHDAVEMRDADSQGQATKQVDGGPGECEPSVRRERFHNAENEQGDLVVRPVIEEGCEHLDGQRPRPHDRGLAARFLDDARCDTHHISGDFGSPRHVRSDFRDQRDDAEEEALPLLGGIGSAIRLFRLAQQG